MKELLKYLNLSIILIIACAELIPPPDVLPPKDELGEIEVVDLRAYIDENSKIDSLNNLDVEITGAPPDTTIYLAFYDPDDPAHNFIIDPNDTAGGDNKGAPPEMPSTLRINFYGEGNFTFKIRTEYLGDNYQIIAWLGEDSSITDVISVWKRFHIEYDHQEFCDFNNEEFQKRLFDAFQLYEYFSAETSNKCTYIEPIIHDIDEQPGGNWNEPLPYATILAEATTYEAIWDALEIYGDSCYQHKLGGELPHWYALLAGVTSIATLEEGLLYWLWGCTVCPLDAYSFVFIDHIKHFGYGDSAFAFTAVHELGHACGLRVPYRCEDTSCIMYERAVLPLPFLPKHFCPNCVKRLREITQFKTPLISLQYSKNPNENNELSISVSLDKIKYMIFEPVWANIYIKNNSKKIQLISPDLHDALFAIINAKEGKIIKTWRMHILYAEPRHIKLPPDSSVTFKINLLRRLAKKKYLPPGDYIFWIEYGARSNTVRFVVIEPPGEDSAICHLYLKYTKMLGGKEAKEAIKGLRQIVNDYPNSLFAPKAQENIIQYYAPHILGINNITGEVMFYKKGDIDTAILETKKLLELFPNSKEAKRYLSKLIEFYALKGQIDECLEYLHWLCPKVKGTELEDRIKEILSQSKTELKNKYKLIYGGLKNK